MKRLLAAASLAALALATSAPASADIFTDIARGAETAARDVGRAAATAANDVSDWGEGAVNDAADWTEGAVDDAAELGETAVDAAGAALVDTGEMALRNGEIAGGYISDGAVAAVEGAVALGELVAHETEMLIAGDAADRAELASRMYARVEALAPLAEAVIAELNDTERGRRVVELVKQERFEEAAIALSELGSFGRFQRAARAAGFETFTLGVSGDMSLAVGYVSEIGMAVDLEHEGPVRGYATIGYTLGLSAGADVGLAMGLWTAENDALSGDSWGSVAAAAPGGGASAGAWFNYDEAYNRGLGAFQGVTFTPSYGVSVEIGELNRVTTVQF